MKVNETTQDTSASVIGNVKTIESWLPGFNGFYGSWYENSEDKSHEALRILEEIGLNFEPFLSHSDDIFKTDWSAYLENCAKAITERTQDVLKVVIPGLQAIDFQTVKSPKEYNFTNDAINCVFVFSDFPAFSAWLAAMLKENAQLWERYLIDHYKSRDGFISWYSHTPEAWKAETENYMHLDAHRLGACLNFYVEKVFPDDPALSETDLCGEELESANMYMFVIESVFIGEYMELLLIQFEDFPADLQETVLDLENVKEKGAIQVYEYAKALSGKKEKAYRQHAESVRKINAEMWEAVQNCLDVWTR